MTKAMGSHGHTMESLKGVDEALIIYDRFVNADHWTFLIPLDSIGAIQLLARLLSIESVKTEAFTIEGVGAIVFIHRSCLDQRTLNKILLKHGIQTVTADKDAIVADTVMGGMLFDALRGAFKIGEDAALGGYRRKE